MVIEEFKQRYLNQPYGDVFLLLRPLAYLKHPYKWATIGKEVSHIADASMEEVKAFFYKHYRPSQAILSIVGDVELQQIEKLANKWFADIPAGEPYIRNLPKEEIQTEARSLTVERDVPLDAIYKAYHMVNRKHPDYYATDLLSDILSRGNSSRFYQRLIKEKQMFTELDAYISGDMDEGLLIVAGKLNPNMDIPTAEKAIEEELNELSLNLVSDDELDKVKNKIISSHQFSINSPLNKAMTLAISDLIDSPDLINKEVGFYEKVTTEDIHRIAKEVFQSSNCSTLYYKSKNKR